MTEWLRYGKTIIARKDAVFVIDIFWQLFFVYRTGGEKIAQMNDRS